jgi:H+/Cl- antiporter ClcA
LGEDSTTRREKREAYYFVSGIALGALLGLFGNIFATWLYETYKNTATWNNLVTFSVVLFFIVLFISVIILMRLGKEADL